LVKDLPDKSSARAEVDRLHLHLDQVDPRGKVNLLRPGTPLCRA
jgi:hypothetical protein